MLLKAQCIGNKLLLINTGSWAAQYAASSCAADEYSSLVNDLLNSCEMPLQVLMDVSNDPCATEQVT
ncbi:hypothetical protein R5R35_012515 [Gryllus longicercus]|uniref:Uncharacterized protein n=1 Tax=Gryllus longicercus TaxID=2509291 RepID=A0AAN9Z2H4_9ORTH